MTKIQLAEKMAEITGKPKSQMVKAIDAFTEAVGAELKNGETVTLVGFGSFSVKTTNARTARNPRTGESVAVPAKQKAVFKASKDLV